MKKLIFTFLSLVFISTHMFAQGEMDAQRFSREALYGTARAMGMGGAFGALGGDQTGVSINPAGIAVYRSSEVAGTLGFYQETEKVGNMQSSVNKFDFDNLGFVGYFPLRNDAIPMINFGFTYNKLKSFDKDISARGAANDRLIDYIADRSTAWAGDPVTLEMGEGKPDPFLQPNIPWLSILGFNSYLIDDKVDNQGYFYTPLNTNGENPTNEIWSQERGYIDNYDFTVGTTVNNVINLGMSLSVKSIFHSLSSEYWEDYSNGSYGLLNSITTTGAGFSAKFGAIYRPTNILRVGLAYHTPTWYSITETFEAAMDDDMGAYVPDPNYSKDRTVSRRVDNFYNLKTPGKIVASLAGVFGDNFIASMDYELVNYKNMKLSVPSTSNDNADAYDYDNEYISTDFKPASTVKLGMEYRFTPQFSGRLGYAWMQNPYKTKFADEANAGVSGSNTIFRIEGDANYFTGGLGYRFNRNFFVDLAVVYKTQNDDLYGFPNLYDTGGQRAIDSSPFALTNNSLRGLVTLGYKF